MNSRLTPVMLLLCAAWIVPAFAAEKAPSLPDLSKETPQAFQTKIDLIHAQMHKGGRYEYITHDNREQVDTYFAQMKTMIEQSGSVQAMNAERRVKLFNAQEKVNGILTHSDSQRLICRHSVKPGSLFRVTTCRTYAEERRRTREDQHTLEQTQNRLRSQLPSAQGGP